MQQNILRTTLVFFFPNLFATFNAERNGWLEAWGGFVAFWRLLLLFWEDFIGDDFWAEVCDDFLADEDVEGFLLLEVVGWGGICFWEEVEGLFEDSFGFWEEVEGLFEDSFGFWEEVEALVPEVETLFEEVVAFWEEAEGLFPDAPALFEEAEAFWEEVVGLLEELDDFFAEVEDLLDEADGLLAEDWGLLEEVEGLFEDFVGFWEEAEGLFEGAAATLDEIVVLLDEADDLFEDSGFLVEAEAFAEEADDFFDDSASLFEDVEGLLDEQFELVKFVSSFLLIVEFSKVSFSVDEELFNLSSLLFIIFFLSHFVSSSFNLYPNSHLSHLFSLLHFKQCSIVEHLLFSHNI